MSNAKSPTACVIIIGNEILSGRTQDINLNYIAVKLGAVGIPVREARVIPDVPETIMATVNECRAKYTYVFTTGGIGPTHDDITSECVSAAFGLPHEVHPEALAIMETYYASVGSTVNAARLRMATMPRGAKLIYNTVNSIPSFSIENVYVLAGIPRIMQGMLDGVIPSLEHGKPVVSQSVGCLLREGDLAAALEAIQKQFPDLDIGSYPAVTGDMKGVVLVAKGTDEEAVARAAEEIAKMIVSLGDTPQRM